MAQGRNSSIAPTLELQSATAASSWVFPLKLKGLTAVTGPDGGIELVSSSGQVVAQIGSGYAADSSFAPKSGEPAQTNAVTYQLVSYQGSDALQVSLDRSWLDDPARVFPVKVSGFGDIYPAPAGTVAPGGATASVSARRLGGGRPLQGQTISCTNNSTHYCANPDTGGTYVQYPYTNNYSGDTVLKIGNDGSGSYAESYLQFKQIGSALSDAHITAASLNLFDIWAYYCGAAEPWSVYRISQSWTVNASYSWSTRPSTGTAALGTYSGTAPSSACSNTGLNPSTGGWMSADISGGDWLLNDWTLGANAGSYPNDGLAVATGTAASDDYEWKKFDSDNASANIPYLELTYAADQAPQVNETYPQDNYNVTSLTPELQATGSDPDSWPDSLGYYFAVYDSTGKLVANSTSATTAGAAPGAAPTCNQSHYTSGWLSKPDWSPPNDELKWGQVYYYVAWDCDGLEEGVSDATYITTQVPQPTVGQAGQNGGAHGISPGSSDYTTSATDASTPTVGPSLSITRDYDSGDITEGAFGAGWSSILDMQVSGGVPNTEVVTYPDGTEVAFGKNYDGSYSSPPGRYATLASVTGGFTLTDKNDTVFTFTQALTGGTYGISSITDALGNKLTFSWNGSGEISQMTSASGRHLNVTWSTPSGATVPHVASVYSDPVTGTDQNTDLTWQYNYSGNELTSVCPPIDYSHCTSYSYTAGTLYPDAVLDSGPHSYWRLDEASGATKAASSVLANEQTDAGTYSSVTLGQAGPLPGSTATSGNFSAQATSYVNLPRDLVNSASYQTVALWFKTTYTGRVLFGTSGSPITSTNDSTYTPVLYVGTDGMLRGEFWDGTSADSMSSGTSVADGNWHLAVITCSGTGESMYLDGSLKASLSGKTVDNSTTSYDYIGAGFLGGNWPDIPSGDVGASPVATYTGGNISDVGFWDRPLTGAEVSALWGAASAPAQQLTKITRPSGNVYGQVAYSTLTGAVTQVTDDNGGTWQVAAPTVAGSSQVYVSSVLGEQPADYWRLADSGTTAVNQVNGGTATYSNVTQGASGPFSDSQAATFNGTSSYLSLPTGLVTGTGNQTYSLWFKTSTAGGVLLASSQAAVGGSAGGPYTPLLYVDTKGDLEGELWNGTAAPIATSTKVDDGNWHNAVLIAGTSGTNFEALWLDGVKVGNLSGTAEGSGEPNVYVGTGFIGNSWPNEPHSGGTPAPWYFNGSISDVAVYNSVFSPATVAAEWAAAKHSGGLTPVETQVFTDPGQKAISYQMDPLNGDRMIAQTDAVGSGNTTKFGYNLAGFQASVTDPDGNVTLTGFDVRGNVVSQTTCQDLAEQNCSTDYTTYYPDDTTTSPAPDPRNDLPLTEAGPGSASATDTKYLTTYTYNSVGELTAQTSPQLPGYPNGLTATSAYTTTSTPAYSSSGVQSGTTPPGLPLTETSPGGAVTSWEYYADGDVYQVTDPNGTRTTYTYDGVGRELAKTVYSSAYPGGLATSYAYNRMGEVTTESDPRVTDPVGSPHTAQITTSYDSDGDVLSQTVADLSGGDTSRQVSNSYTSYDQLKSSTDGAGNSTNYTYDSYGNLATETDPAGNVTKYTYDPDGDLLTATLTNYNGTAQGLCQTVSGGLVESSRTYDPAGRLASVTDAACDTTAYTYTGNGLVSTITRCSQWTGSSCGGYAYTEEANTYNPAGQLTGRVTNNGQTTTSINPNAVGQVTSRTLDPAGLDRTTSYMYSPDDQVLQQQVSGGGSSTPAQLTDYAYDPMGNMTSQSVHDDASPGTAPAGWWPLAQSAPGAESYAPDASGNGYTGSLSSGGVSWGNGAAQFGGISGDGITISATSIIDTSKSFSVSAWVNMASSASYQSFVTESSTEQDGFQLAYDGSSGKWTFARATSDSASPSWASAESGSAAQTGTWMFLTGTFDASSDTLTLYVNGTQSGNTATDSTPFKATGPLVIGYGEYGGSPYEGANGSIADVQVYPYAMSASQASTLYGYGRGGGALGETRQTTSWNLDQRGLPVSMTDPNGNTTSYVYDQAGHLAQQTSPPVAVRTFASQTPTTVAPVTSFGYDTFGDKVIREDPNGNETFTGYNGNGQPTAVTGPAYTPPDGSGTITPVTTTSYDNLGQVHSVTNPLQNATTYSYDQLGDVTSVQTPDGQTTLYAYDQDGNQKSVTTPDGVETETLYDFMGRPQSSTLTSTQSGAPADTTTYAYSANGLTATYPWQTSQTTQDGVTTKHGYDAAGEVTSVTDGAQNSTGYSYDAAGRLVKTINPDQTYSTTTYDEAGNPLGQADYSSSGSQLRSASATFDGDGNQVSATDWNQNKTTFAYNPADELTSEVQPVTSSSSVTTKFGYDTAGNPTLYTDGKGSNWWMTYNSWNLPESRVEPPTSSAPSAADGTFTTSYDANGNPVQVADPGGITLTSAYDKMDRPLSEAGSGAGATTGTRNFSYNNDGQLTSAATPSASDTFSYDPLGELSSASGQSGSSSFTWNGDGLPASVTDAAGTTSYTYDSADRLHTLADPVSGSTLSYSYTPQSQVSQIAYGSGDTQSFGYNGLHQLTSQALKTSGGATVASVSYGYDNNGNLTTKATTGFAGASSNSYTYDDANRLTSWNNGTTAAQYGYDNNGNRITVGSKSYTYDARDELTSDGTNSYSYTDAGTLASVSGSSGTSTFTSDAFGQAITQAGQTYSYDALGRAVSDTGPGGNFTFTWDGTSDTMASDGGNVYSWDPTGTQLVGEGPNGSPGSGVLTLTDAHTDVTGQFSASGTALTGSRTYDPLGNVTATGGTMSGNLGYQSGWTDPANGRVDMNARWYDPSAGQFTSRDTASVSPVPDEAAANPFAYAADNPLTGTDPTGHMYMDAGGGGGNAATAAAITRAMSYVRPAPAPSCSGFFGCLVHDAESVGSGLGHAGTAAWHGVVHVYHATVHVVAAIGRDVYHAGEYMLQANLALLKAAAREAGHVAHAIGTGINDAYHSTVHALGTAWHATTAATAAVTHTVTHWVSDGYHAAVHVVHTAAHAVAAAATATVRFVQHHAAAIASFVVSTGVFIGCEAALGVETAGVGAVVGAAACGELAGAAGNAVGYGITAAQTGRFSWSGLANATAQGAASGLLGGALGGAGAEVLGALGGVASRLLTAGAADSTAEAATSAAAQGMAGDAAASASSDGAGAVADTSAGNPVGAGTQAEQKAAEETGAARGPDFIASQDGNVVSTSRARLEGGFQDAGFPSTPTRSPGMQYTLPDGSLVRIMEPSGQAPLRASFTDSYGNAINPFTGKQPMPPPGVTGAAWRQLMRSLTHVELGP